MTPLQKDLRALANWCLLRSVQSHDPHTTLSILTRKVARMQASKYKHDTVPEADSDSYAESSMVGER